MVGVVRAIRAVRVGALSLMMLSPLAAEAEEPSARAWFEVGVKSYEEGQYATALAAFQEAYRLSPRAGLLFSIAQTLRRGYEVEGNPARRRDAIDYYQRYLTESPQGERSAEARSWIEQLELAEVPSRSGPALARTDAERDASRSGNSEDAAAAPVALRSAASSIEIVGGPGAVVYIDGRRVATLPMLPLRVETGRHTLEVLQAGHHGVRRVVDLEPGATQRLDLAGPPTVRHVASWLFVGAGAAAVVTGGVFGYLALQREEDARALQETPGARLEFDSAVSSRNRLRGAAALSAGLGLTALVGGAVSLITERPAPPPPPMSTAASDGLTIDFAFPSRVIFSGKF